MFETTALVVSAVEQALFTRRRAEIRFSSTLIGRHSSIDYNLPIIAPSPSSDSSWNPATELPMLISVGILVRSGLGNRRVGSQGPPCADEVPLATRQPMTPTVLNGSAANVGGA